MYVWIVEGLTFFSSSQPMKVRRFEFDKGRAGSKLVSFAHFLSCLSLLAYADQVFLHSELFADFASSCLSCLGMSSGKFCSL